MRKLLSSLLWIFVAISCSSPRSEAPIVEKSDNSFNISLPVLLTGDPTLDLAFRIAVGDLFTNIQDYESKMTGEIIPVLIAGVDYNNPWIRDAAINSWNAGSFIVPEVSKNTLYSVLKEDENGLLRMTGQYWDAIIWSTGAWNHYLTTGDREFLKTAFEVTKTSLDYYEETEFNAEYNLFRGLGWSDGVAAYPKKYASTNMQSGAYLWPKYNKDKVSKPGYGIPMMATSTNCLYYNAYSVVQKMAEELGEKDEDHWSEKGLNLKTAINNNLWNEKTGVYSFYIDEEGVCELQEALGSAYAIMFGIASDSQIESIFKNQHISAAGVTCGWPELPRFKTDKDGMSFGRHNVTVWPQIQGMWADVAAKNHEVEIFAHELFNLANHAVRDMQFSEMYHPVTGERYGGMQASGKEITLWESTRRQTWSATAYMRMIFSGLFGIGLNEKGIGFSPCIPTNLNEIRLTGMKYQDMLLNISITGNGTRIKSFKVNGLESEIPFISFDRKGLQSVEIVLE
jgi:hypothetical protein